MTLMFLGLGAALGTTAPLRVVTSGSMCLEHPNCDGWSHPFEPSLHVNDIILIQAINPKDLNTNYPNSDIIVYQRPDNPAAIHIVHRIVASYEQNGALYFQTKGDGNGKHWPAPVTPAEYDSHTIWNTNQGIPPDHILGKVILRIPYLGWITRTIQSTPWTLPTIIVLITLLVIIEFVIPIIKTQNKKKQRQEQPQIAHTTL